MHLKKLVKKMSRRHKELTMDFDKQRDLAKETIATMEDLYLRFEKEKSYIQLKLEREYDDRIKHERERYEQKLAIFKQVNEMGDAHNMEQAFYEGGEHDPNGSIEYARAQIYVTQVSQKNQELIGQISELQMTLKVKNDEIEQH